MNAHCGDTYGCKYISWHAILGGALVAIGLTFLFNLLTVGLGLSMYTKNPAGQQVLAFAGFAWILIGSYVLAFLSGWVTGRLIFKEYSWHGCNGLLHGFIMWAVFLILSILIFSHMTENTAALLKSTFTTISSDTTNVAVNATGEVNTTTGAVNTGTPTTQEVRKVGWSTLGTFFVFLAGAFGAAIGGYYGVSECRKCGTKIANTPNNPNTPSSMMNR